MKFMPKRNSRGVLCNAVDEPERCDFYFPAVVRRGELQIAISTGGLSPALAQRLRKELEQQFGPEWEEWVAQLGRTRDELKSIPMPPEQRKRLLHQYASLDPEAALVQLARPWFWWLVTGDWSLATGEQSLATSD